MAGFLNNPMLMEDRYDVDDLFGMQSIQDDIWKKIQWLPNKSMLALVWPYGSGKSTIVHNIKQQHDDWGDDPVWVQFDAWKYPERHDLWEWFIFELAERIGSVSQTARRIEWGKSVVQKLAELVPWADKVIELFNTNFWAKRVFEMQKILQAMIEWFDRNINIVVEDIDRSGEYGTRFLETLWYFLKNHNFWDKEIRVIVLIWDENYQKDMESYLKCIDVFEFNQLLIPDYQTFVEYHFLPDLIEGANNDNVKKQLISFLEELTGLKKFTFRLIKNILRRADLVYTRQKDDGFNPDFRRVIILEASRYHISSPDYVISDYMRVCRADVIHIDSIMWKMLKMTYFVGIGSMKHFVQLQSSPQSVSPIRIINSKNDWPFFDEHTLDRFYFRY